MDDDDDDDDDDSILLKKQAISYKGNWVYRGKVFD